MRYKIRSTGQTDEERPLLGGGREIPEPEAPIEERVRSGDED
jgi:hypothetical protein